MSRRKPRAEEPNLFSLRCQECSAQLVSTPSGYLACPTGRHGKLIRDEDGWPEQDQLDLEGMYAE
jgi:hypothetical protein